MTRCQRGACSCGSRSYGPLSYAPARFLCPSFQIAARGLNRVLQSSLRGTATASLGADRYPVGRRYSARNARPLRASRPRSATASRRVLVCIGLTLEPRGSLWLSSSARSAMPPLRSVLAVPQLGHSGAAAVRIALGRQLGEIRHQLSPASALEASISQSLANERISAATVAQRAASVLASSLVSAPSMIARALAE